MMREPRLVWGLALATLAPTASPKVAWRASGSGTDTTITLEAPGARPTFSPVWPKLVLKCHDRKPMLGFFIGSLDFMGSLNENVATVRFDREPAFRIGVYNWVKWSKLWMKSTTIDPGTVFFFKPEQMVASLLRHRRMLVRVTPSYGPAQEVSFDLPGLEQQLPAFEKACDLKEPIERAVQAPASPPRSAPAARPAAPVAPPLQTFGAWTQSVTTSKVDDLPIVVLSLPPARGAPASRLASLVFRCREKQTEAFLSFDLPLSAAQQGAYLVVRASVDGGAQDKEWWLAPSTDQRAYFFGSAPQLLKRLLASQELRLAYRPRKRPENYEWMPKGEAVFKLAGLDRALRAFLGACPIDLAKVKVKDGLAKLP
jgi:hypothetical protein